jgi:ubiquinone/menaquinone biosynthesis C-methylase UbiE
MTSPQEHPSTYFVQDRSNEEELMRLQLQDQMLTTGMGGVLSEQPDPTSFKRVLDVGCGTGGWLIETAKAYPTIKRLVGVDISRRVVLYAREQAERAGVADRVEFHVMDALRLLEFPAGYFDLVNQRLAVSFLRTWDWPKLLSEYRRVTRPSGLMRLGGVIRVTEGYTMTCNSPALTRLWDLFLQASYRAGHLFTPDGDGVINKLEWLLKQYADLKQVQTCDRTLEYRAGTKECQSHFEDIRIAFRVLEPFLRKWTRLPDDYHETYKQALLEMQQPDFVSTWHFPTIWGNKE